MKTGILAVADILFETLLALSYKEQQQGLMYVKPPTPVMSFVYATPQINKFWMANTPAPLDIVFCHNNKITQICQGQPFSTSPIGADQLSNLIVEFPAGTVKSSNLKLGQSIELIKPNFVELKKIIASIY